MRLGQSTARSTFAVGLVAGALAFAGGCSSDDGGGGGGAGGTGSGGIGGFGAASGTGGTGGGGTGGGGTGGGGGGCPAAPGDCQLCQEEEYVGCACADAENACLGSQDCLSILGCVYDGEGSLGPCLDFTADDAACVNACADLYPAGKALYLAYENCSYCNYCKVDCNTDTYCDALANPLDAGATDAGSDGSTDAASDAATDGGASDAASDGGASDAASDGGASDAASDT